jgi:hypothetical protein
LVADQVSARFTAPFPLKDMTTGSYHYPCVFSVEWDYKNRGDRIVMPLRGHATKLTDLDDSQLSRFSKGLAALVVDGSCVQHMSETITAGLVTLADKVVAKRDGRAKFSVRPDKLIASLVAQKNAAARKEARARRGQADMSALYGAEKKRISVACRFVGFLDLSNAFPTTWREGLFTKLFAMLGDCRSVRLAQVLVGPGSGWTCIAPNRGATV